MSNMNYENKRELNKATISKDHLDNHGNGLVVKDDKVLIPSEKIKNLVKDLTDDEIEELFACKRVYEIFGMNEIYS